MGLELTLKLSKFSRPIFLHCKNLSKNFSSISCDENSSYGARFFDEIWQKTSRTTYIFNGKLQLPSTQKLHSREFPGSGADWCWSAWIKNKIIALFLNMLAWPSGLRRRQILLASKEARVRISVPPKNVFFVFWNALDSECKCKTCEKSFQTNQNLKVHNSRVHSVTTDTSVMENTGQDGNNAL